MEALVVLALVGVANAAPSHVLPYYPYSGYTGTVLGVAAPLAPFSYTSKHHAQDELGQVNYGFAHFGQAKNEIRDAFGNVAGVYTYIDANNDPVHVQYTAGVNGFEVKSNNLPVAPDAPVVDLPVAPKPVMDTPEVAAAKLEFFEAFNAAVAAAAAAATADEEAVTETTAEEEAVTEATAEEEVVTEVAEEPVTEEAVVEEEEKSPEEGTVEEETSTAPSTLVAPEPVMDTEEVAKAKADFQAAYEAAAAAAAAGAVPEVEMPTGSPVHVMDTDEVAAARAEFQAAYEAAAAAAEAAADFDLDGSVSQYSGYLSALDGALSPTYTNTFLHGAHGIHAQLVPPAVAPAHVAYNHLDYGYYHAPVYSV